MSRYSGPRVKILRALGTDLPGLTRKTRERRPYPPGQHGQARKKLSEYALRLMEKQKLRANYGLTEGQLRRVMVEARSGKGNTTSSVVQLLESRLDNLVFRAGFARSIAGARQLVNHGHILVNGRKLDIASCRVKPGQTIQVRERSRKLTAIEGALATPLPFPTPWLEVNAEQRSAKLTQLPEDDAIPFALNMQLVIEYYSNRL
jgi:small subunit ribosomal protein S4